MRRPTLVVERSHSAPDSHSSPAKTHKETSAKTATKSVGKLPKLPQIFAPTRMSEHLPRSQQHFHASQAKKKKQTKKSKQIKNAKLKEANTIDFATGPAIS